MSIRVIKGMLKAHLINKTKYIVRRTGHWQRRA